MSRRPGPKSRRRAKLIAFLVQRDGERCEWCGLVFADPVGEATLDHVVPLARGGSNKRRNLVLACRPCNEQRGANHEAPQVRRLGGLPS